MICARKKKALSRWPGWSWGELRECEARINKQLAGVVQYTEVLDRHRHVSERAPSGAQSVLGDSRAIWR